MPEIYEKIGRRYKPRPDLDALGCFGSHGLIIGAQRYYIGRSTIHAACFAEHELARAWSHLPAGTRSVMQRDIEEEFRRDDEARAEKSSYLPLGWDCDRAAWAKVREHWHGKDVPLAPHVPMPTEIKRKLTALGEQMLELGAAMEYVGGLDVDMATRGRRMVEAGLVVQEWANTILENKN